MKTYFMAFAIAVAGVSTAATFDFESATAGNYTTLSLTDGGVTASFSRSDSSDFSITNDSDLTRNFPAAWGNQALGGFVGGSATGITVDFDVDLLSASVDIGDFGFDSDSLSLVAYDGAGGTGSVVDTAGSAYSGDIEVDGSGVLLTVSGSGIKSIVMNGIGNGSVNSVYYDNLEVTAVPEPATLALLGLGALAAYRKRKSA